VAQEVLIYWLLAQAFGLAGLPLARALFHALPDRGYAFAKSLGLLLAGYLAWLAAMLGLAPFGAPLVVVCAALVAAAGLLVERRAQRHPEDARRTPEAPRTLGFHATPIAYRLSPITWPFAWLRGSWRMVLGYEALFALALLFLALLRSYEYGFVGPNPWGTERPMDYALFNAIRQSERFPPHDPWLAGYSINYYYFGYLLMAALAEVGRLSPAAAYNLSLALIFALAALGAAGMVYNLVGLTGVERPTLNVQRWNVQRSAFGRWAAMTLAVVLVLFAGNQGAALQVITGSDMAVALRAPDLARAIANGLGPRATIPLGEPFRGDYFDGTSEIAPGDQVEGFNWWNSSRAVWDTYPDGSRRYAITEFPFFSFWLGDMHPHVMALPFGLLALALALQTLARPDLPGFGRTRRGWLVLALSGFLVVSLFVI
jgi:YYY domain-containing protein